MAKKRLNTRFIAILLGSVVAVGGGVLVINKFVLKADPRKYIIGGDAAFADGKYDIAYDAYARAASLGKPDAALFMKIGSTARLASYQRPDLVGADRRAWEQALTIDPNYLPALQQLVTFYQQVFNAQPSIDIYNKLREYAERVAKADPTDKKNAITIQITTVQAWLHDLAIDEDRLVADEKLIEEAAKANPTDERLPQVVCTYYLKRAVDAAKNRRKSEYEANIKSAVDFADQATKAGDKSAAVQVRMLQVYGQLMGTDRAGRDKYDQKFIATLDRARGLVKPEDPLYLETMLYAAERTMMAKNKDETRKIFDELIEKRPNDVNGRLAYAQWLSGDKATRQQAIDLLLRPVTKQGDVTDPYGQARLRQAEIRARIAVATYRIDMLDEVTGEDAKAKLKSDIETEITRLDSDLKGNPMVLKLRGRYELVQLQNKKAVETLESARNAINSTPQYQGDVQLRSEVLGMLAQAYLNVAQSGTAKPILRELTTIAPNPTVAHKMLFQIAAQETDLETMKTELGILQRLAPSDPDLAKMEFAVSGMTGGNQADLRKRYENMPEKTLADMYAKSRAAQALTPPDLQEAEAMLRKCAEARPSDPTIVRDLALVLVRVKKQSEAEDVVTKAMAANPNELNFKVLLLAVQKKSPSEIQNAIRDNITDEKDEFTRERRLFELAYSQNDIAEGRKHALRMYELKPDNKAAIDPYFNLLLSDKKFDDANKLLERITAKDLDEAGGRIYKFQLQMAQGNKAEALATAREVVSKLSEFAQSYVILGQALEGQNPPDFAQALQNYEIALQRQPNNVEALRLAINANFRLGRSDDAKKYIDQALRVRPGEAAFRDIAMQWEVQFGDPEKVIPAREEVVKNRPEQSGAYIQLAGAYMAAAQKKAQQGDAAATKAYADKAMGAMLTAVQKGPDEALAYQSLAAVAIQSSDPTPAIAVLEGMQKRPAFEKSGAPQALLAEVYARRNMIEQAEKAYKAALEIEPGNNSIRAGYVNLLSRMGNRQGDALKVMEGTPKDQRDSTFQQRMMELYARSGKLDEGEVYVRKLLETDPKNAAYQNLLTMMLVNSFKYKEAQEQAAKTMATAAANTDESDVARYYRAITVLRLNGSDVSAAITDLQFLRNKNANNIEVRLALAEALRRTNDTDGAMSELRQALNADPHNKAIRIKLVQFCVQTVPPRWTEAERLLADSISQPEFSRDPDFFVAISDMWLARKEPLRAVDAIRKAVELAPGNAAMIRTYLTVLLQAGNADQVIKETDALIKEGADAPWIYQARGSARAIQKNQEQAVAEYEIAMNKSFAAKDMPGVEAISRSMAADVGYDAAIARLTPRLATEPSLGTLVAILHMSGSKPELAVGAITPLLDKVDSLPPAEQALVLQTAGTIFVAPGPTENIEKGYESYKKLLVLNPDNMTALNNLSCLLLDRFTPPKAAEALQYSTRLYQNLQHMGQFDPTLVDTHGWALIMNNRDGDAIPILQDAADRAARTGRDFPEVHYHLAQAFFKTDAPELAKGELEKAMKVADKVDELAKLNRRSGTDPAIRLKIEIDLKKADELLATKNTPKR